MEIDIRERPEGRSDLRVNYRLVVFDFDGTLADTFSWFTGIVERLALQYRFKRVEEDEFEMLRSSDVRKTLEHLGIPLWKTPRIARTMRALMEQDAGRISRFSGVDRMLERLDDRGITLGVVSSNSCRNIHRILGPRNVERIDYCECGVSLFGKAARLKSVLKRSGIPPEEGIYIGDEIRDLEAARRVRMAFGAVSWGYNRIEALRAHSPDAVFTRFEEIVPAEAKHERDADLTGKSGG